MNRLTAQKAAFFTLFFLLLVISANAQEEKTPAKTTGQVTADESFTLNISESRINETNYERSTDVRIGANNQTGVEVQVGATVRARNITINLRGVTGNVRFRASLEKIRRLTQ